jgi:hypothetical protein
MADFPCSPGRQCRGQAPDSPQPSSSVPARRREKWHPSMNAPSASRGDLYQSTGSPASEGCPSHAPPVVHGVLNSAGRPLDPDVRAFMEARFGQDLSPVRVHTDDAAALSARAVAALAYTVGNHIVFDAGRYSPQTHGGRHLLAHELSHVVQQASRPVTGRSIGEGLSLSDPADPFEREAEQTAGSIMGSPGRLKPGSSQQPPLGPPLEPHRGLAAPPATVQRAPGDPPGPQAVPEQEEKPCPP